MANTAFYTALWGPKGFIVSPNKIVPLNGLTTAFAVKADNGNDAASKSTTNIKGRELQPLSLSTIYVRGAGVDPRSQIAEWEALVGKAHPLYIEGQRFGPQKLMLKSVNVSDILLTNTGKFLKCAVALEFEEYTNNANATTKTLTSAASKSAALNATASPMDRSALKPTVEAVIFE
jgi:hypothetical protein